MTTPFNEQELIQLNAYLDGELSGEERKLFEQHLAEDPALQTELRAIRATKMLLGMAERQRAPRNFTLDPAVYGKPARRSLWDRLGLASIPAWAVASAALVVVVVFVGVLIFNRPGAGLMTADVAMEARTAEQAPAEAAADEAAAAPVEEPAEEPAAAEPEMEAFGAEMAEEEQPAADNAAAAGADGLGGGLVTPGMGTAGGGLPPAPTVIGPADSGLAEEETPSAALAVPPVGEAAEAAGEGGAEEAAPLAESVITEEEAAEQAAPAELQQAMKVTEQPPAAQTAEAVEAARQMRQPRTMLIVGLAAAVLAALVVGIWMAVRAGRR